MGRRGGEKGWGEGGKNEHKGNVQGSRTGQMKSQLNWAISSAR